jgi:hypothetical protein
LSPLTWQHCLKKLRDYRLATLAAWSSSGNETEQTQRRVEGHKPPLAPAASFAECLPAVHDEIELIGPVVSAPWSTSLTRTKNLLE